MPVVCDNLEHAARSGLALLCGLRADVQVSNACADLMVIYVFGFRPKKPHIELTGKTEQGVHWTAIAAACPTRLRAIVGQH
eukprot:6726856-Pyramimonas_sp.AAC.1